MDQEAQDLLTNLNCDYLMEQLREQGCRSIEDLSRLRRRDFEEKHRGIIKTVRRAARRDSIQITLPKPFPQNVLKETMATLDNVEESEADRVDPIAVEVSSQQFALAEKEHSLIVEETKEESSVQAEMPEEKRLPKGGRGSNVVSSSMETLVQIQDSSQQRMSFDDAGERNCCFRDEEQVMDKEAKELLKKHKLNRLIMPLTEIGYTSVKKLTGLEWTMKVVQKNLNGFDKRDFDNMVEEAKLVAELSKDNLVELQGMLKEFGVSSLTALARFSIERLVQRPDFIDLSEEVKSRFEQLLTKVGNPSGDGASKLLLSSIAMIVQEKQQEREEWEREKDEWKKKREKWGKEKEQWKQEKEEWKGKSILKYFETGARLPSLTMNGSKYVPSINKSHEPIARKVVKDFGVVDITTEDLEHCGMVPTPVFYLDRLDAASEAGVMGHVKTVLNDIICATKVKELSVLTELSIAELRADSWSIAHRGHPVGAVKVKKPGNINNHSWDIIYGQLYDCLIRIRSFHGVRDVIGLVTNWDEWGFGWLEDSDISATSTDLQYELDNEVTFWAPTPQRKLHVSKRYRRDDVRSLAVALYSWLKKITRNSVNVAPVPWLHPDRSYIKLTADKWVWQKGIPVTELSLWPLRKESDTFYLLRDFYGGRDGRVWLACHVEKSTTNGRTGKLAVIKFLTTEEGNEAQRAQTEVGHWHKLGISSVYSTLLSGRHAIVMPLGFHYNEDPMIDSKWWRPPDNPPIEDFSDVFAEVSRCVPENVLDKCIEKCAVKKLVHCDIEWRHVAIFPKRTHQPSTDTWTIELEYCFIDLSSMKEVASKKVAKTEMMKSKRLLVDDDEKADSNRGSD